MTFRIHAPDRTLADPLQQRIDQKTKPQGALGRLEPLALQLGSARGATAAAPTSSP